MKNFLFLFVFLFSFTFAFSTPQNKSLSDCSLTNATVVSQTDSSVSIDWDCSCNPIEYRVFYVKNGQVSQELSTGISEITLSGLSAGVYQVHIYAVSASGTSSIIIDEVLM